MAGIILTKLTDRYICTIISDDIGEGNFYDAFKSSMIRQDYMLLYSKKEIEEKRAMKAGIEIGNLCERLNNGEVLDVKKELSNILKEKGIEDKV